MANRKQKKVAKAKTQARMKAAKASKSAEVATPTVDTGKIHVRAYERRRPRKR